MKKSSFVALVMGTVSGLLFALGMCMALLPEWNSFWPGVVMGGVGLVLGLATLLVWRKMEKKPAVKLSGKGFLAMAVGVVGTLLLGVGMCLVMVWEQMIIGIIVGIVGIVGLLSLIPIISGFRD